MTNLSTKVNATIAKHTRRVRDSVAIEPLQQTVTHSSVGLYSVLTLEADIALLRYLDPATGTLTTVAGGSGTYAKAITVQSIYTRCQIRSNYLVPAWVTVYFVRPQNDTSLSPNAAYANGLPDQSADTVPADTTSPLMFVTDVDFFKNEYEIVQSWKRKLEPGQTMAAWGSIPKFQYRPSDFDTDNTTYQRRFGSHAFFFRVEGEIGHDPVDPTN